MKSLLEQEYDTAPGSVDRDQLIKLIKLLQKERDIAQENFHVTNQAYVEADRINRQLKGSA